ncbi:MAG: hypothetical protein F6K09_33590 [Merismopedia sp. SIO2A8]|nr:hypothetical protein [Merismopedia sp. SIO2A8]
MECSKGAAKKEDTNVDQLVNPHFYSPRYYCAILKMVTSCPYRDRQDKLTL